MLRTRAAVAAFVALVTALLVLPPLGQRSVATTDEARFVLYAREVLAHRTLFDVRLRGKLFREKPPLYAWTIAALALPAGRVTEAAAHAPVALAAILTTVFTFLLGDRLFNRRVGLWAGLILATTAGFFRHSQILLPDMIVAAFATAAAYWFWRAMEDPPGRPARVLFYVTLGLAVYAKGPLGLLPLLVGALWLWNQRGARVIAAHLWSTWGFLLFAAITLTWVVPFLTLGSGTYAHTVLWQDWVAAYTLGGPGSALTRGAIDSLGFFAPWVALVPVVLGPVVSARRTPAVAYVFLSFVVPLLVVVMSAHYRTRYLLASVPAFALLVAWWADAHGTRPTRVGRIVAWAGLVGLGVASTLLTLPDPWGLRRALLIPEFSVALIPIVLAGWLLALSVWAGLGSGRPALLVGGASAAMVVLFGYGTWLHNTRLSGPPDIPRLAARLEAHARGAEAGVLHETGWLEVDYYLGRPLRELPTEDAFERFLVSHGGPVLASETTWAQIQGHVSPRIRVLERVKARGRTFVILGWG
ncbi:MAG: ArnT family glycosyltransferase [Candidatus Rokuibacteriota bacterium]